MQWDKLKSHCWIPGGAKTSPEHEPRGGFLLCANHHKDFDQYKYFIRFIPSVSMVHLYFRTSPHVIQVQKFVFVNYSGSLDDTHLDGKAIALDAHHRYTVFPSLFIIHECRVRGFHPFEPVETDLPDDVPWQDWILANNIVNQQTDSLIHERSQGGTLAHTGTVIQRDMGRQSWGTTDAGELSHRNTLAPLNDGTIAEILAFTRSMQSWKACEVEGTSWDGTAEENIKKYVEQIGVDCDSQPP